MKATIINRSEQDIKLVIDRKQITIVSAQEERKIEIAGSEIKISAKIARESEYKKGKCFLRIESMYTFSEVQEGEVLEIISEKSRAIPSVFFERIFIKPNSGICQFEKCIIPDEERMKRLFKKRRVKYFFLIAPIELLTGLVLILAIAGIIATSILGWKFAIVYFTVAYLVLLLISFIALKFSNWFLKKGFGQEDEKKEFYNFFDSMFLEEYYLNPERDICK